MPLHFGKSQRLFEAAAFRKVLEHPEFRWVEKSLTSLALKNEHQKSRLGILVTKRNFPTAVARNKVKRIVRESYRLNQHLLQGFDIVVIPKRNFFGYEARPPQKQLENTWQRLHSLFEGTFRKDKNIVSP